MTARTQQFDPPLKLNRPIHRYSLEQYLEKEAKSLGRRSADKHEFINGQIIKMPYAKSPHNIIKANFTAEKSNNLNESEESFIVFPSSKKYSFQAMMKQFSFHSFDLNPKKS